MGIIEPTLTTGNVDFSLACYFGYSSLGQDGRQHSDDGSIQLSE
jgi:hypothetical protein